MLILYSSHLYIIDGSISKLRMQSIHKALELFQILDETLCNFHTIYAYVKSHISYFIRKIFSYCYPHTITIPRSFSSTEAALQLGEMVKFLSRLQCLYTLLVVYNKAAWKQTEFKSVIESSMDIFIAKPLSGLTFANDNKSVDLTKKFPWKV